VTTAVPDAAELVERAVTGDRGAVAKLISLVERGGPNADDAVAKLFPCTGTAYTVGMTGAPGAGKSTLTDKLVGRIRRDGQEVGVLAVDPTSPFTGGAILGDRVRMQDHATDPGVFIRSMATRGHLGGLSLATPQAVRVLDAAGKPWILIETVGVGQVEVEIAGAADTTVVVVTPGWGDGVQANKAGLMEIGDVFVVNKADRPGADKTVTEVTMMMSLVEEHGDWVPPIVKTVASRSEGIDELDAAIVKHYEYLSASGELDRRNRDRVRIRIETQLKERFMDRLIGGTIAREEYEDLLEEVLRKRNNPHDAAEGVLSRVTF
jgi:LAO/AO transport system kinase